MEVYGAGWSLVIRSRFSNTLCIYTLVIPFVYIHVLHFVDSVLANVQAVDCRVAILAQGLHCKHLFRNF